ncbi:MAG TPA: DUF3089 domain-containing protein [Bacteroidia bacterium]|nr:DUF3089 domain-containing protein [Bacteroidia bacterium]
MPKAPNYADDSCWAALPTKKDSADVNIYTVGIIDKQQTAPIDVFYVHPTTYLFGNKWNASLDDKDVNKKTDQLAVRNQASVFNEMCRVYAPRYRQAVLYSYAPRSTKTGNGAQAFNLAYGDIKAAFEYYLKNYNKGRPFIIASHSQGTDHTIRLLHDFIENDSVLKKQLVAAYIIGRPMQKGSIKAIPPADSANQIGCYITWNSVLWGQKTFYTIKVNDLECVNPLTWRRDTITALPLLNTGSLPQTFNRVDAGLVDAKISPTGLLWIHRPHVTLKDYPYINARRFHVLDYNLFYMNMRENIKLRTETYLRLNSK